MSKRIALSQKFEHFEFIRETIPLEKLKEFLEKTRDFYYVSYNIMIDTPNVAHLTMRPKGDLCTIERIYLQSFDSTDRTILINKKHISFEKSVYCLFKEIGLYKGKFVREDFKILTKKTL